jgi:DNA-binding transcriptional LysR family regulator
MAAEHGNQPSWDDLRIILAIGREGSLSGAARALGSSHTTVFRQINNIEKRYATRFFNRAPNGYEMTEAGELAMRIAATIEEEVLDLNRELQGKDLRLQGAIRLTAPVGISHYLLMPHLARFYKKHPDINIELLPVHEALELARGEADLAIRVTDDPPQNSIAKKVSDFRMAFYATGAYLKKVSGRDIIEHDLVLYSHYLEPLAKTIWKNKPLPRPRFTSNSILTIARAASEGMGTALLPCLIGEKEKKLQRIGKPLESYAAGLWVMTHADLRQTARVKVLMNHLVESLSSEKRYLEGSN